MILNQEKLVGLPVIDLGLEAMVGRTVGIVVDPNDLKVVALRITGVRAKERFLQVNNIREIIPSGIAINSEEVLTTQGESVRLDKVLGLNFSPIGHKVVTKKGTNLGKVLGFTINTENFLVQQIIVRRPPLKALIDAELIIGRSEITEVDNSKITVKDEEQKIREKARTEDFVPNFVNPFRRNGVFSLEKRKPQQKRNS